MKNSFTSHTNISRWLFFVLGLAAGATLSLFFITHKYSCVQIQFQNIISRIQTKQNEIQNSETLELGKTGNTKRKNDVLTSLDARASEKLRVLCLVMTYHPHHQTRARAVRDTWGRHCDILLFMSDVEDPSVPTINTNVTIPKKGVWAMSQVAYNYVLKHYSGQFDWLYKCDGDTYALIENMKKFLVNYSTSKPLFFGFKIKNPHLFMSGGAGYVMSRETLQYLLDIGMNGTYKACSKENAKEYEDVALGECMTQLKVPFVDTRDHFGRERFFTESVQSHTYPYNNMKIAPFEWYNEASVYPPHFGLNCCAEDPISFHHVDYKQMYMMEYLTYLTKQPQHPRILQPEWRAKSTIPPTTKAPSTIAPTTKAPTTKAKAKS